MQRVGEQPRLAAFNHVWVVFLRCNCLEMTHVYPLSPPAAGSYGSHGLMDDTLGDVMVAEVMWQTGDQT